METDIEVFGTREIREIKVPEFYEELKNYQKNHDLFVFTIVNDKTNQKMIFFFLFECYEFKYNNCSSKYMSLDELRNVLQDLSDRMRFEDIIKKYERKVF